MDDSGRKKKWYRIFWILLYNVGFVAGILAGAEYASRMANERAGEDPKPFMFDVGQLRHASIELRQMGTTTKMSYLDPHLGYAHEHATDRALGDGQWLPGFVIYGDAMAEDAFWIVALGGSTTDPIDGNNWPKQMQRILASEGLHAVVCNGGVSGYSTSQELFKLIRDVLPLDPDLVISLSGVNDIAFIHSAPGHPMVHPYQKRLLETVTGEREVMFLPNTRRWIRRWRAQDTPEIERVLGVNYGPQVAANHAEHWARNTRLMHAVAQASNIEYLSFLQPILGVGAYDPAPEDEKLLQDAVKTYGPNYLPLAKDFFAGAGREARQMTFVVDLIDVFNGETRLYRDQRHPNAEGYGQIAQTIRDELNARGLLPRTRQ